MNIPISSPIPQKSPSTPSDSRIKMNKLTRKIGALLSVLLALSQPIVSADPATDAEAAYKESQKEWKSAQDAVTKFVDSGASTDPAITGLQSTFQEKKARLTEETKAWTQVADADSEVVQAKAESDQKAKDRGQFTQGTKEWKTANEAMNRARGKWEKLRNKFKPESVTALEAEVNALRVELRGRIVSYTGSDQAIVDLLNSYRSAQTGLKEARLALDKSKGVVDPLTYLSSSKPPVFNPKSTLPRLTRYGWAMPFDLLKEFADKWGYALSIEGYLGEERLLELKKPESAMARTVELMKEKPGQYKLALICDRYDPPNPPQEVWTRDENGKLLSAQAKSMDGTTWAPGMTSVISPEAPDQYWIDAGDGRARPIAEIRKLVPISIILNGGEWGMGIWGFAGPAWSKDPKVAAKFAEYEAQGKHKLDYIDKKHSDSIKLLSEPVKKAAPDRDLYVYYTVGGNPHRGRDPGWRSWTVTYPPLRGINDLPAAEYYVNHYNTGFVGDGDILTYALNSLGQQLTFGDATSYNWFWAARKDTDPVQYQGFLKCTYIMGSLGGNAGTYHTPEWDKSFPQDAPPDWMWQQIALGNVHALFSHYEDYLRNGELVDDGKFKNFFGTDQPAYELLPKELKNTRQLKQDLKTKDQVAVLSPGRPFRVLARKHKDKNEWLVVAWTAEISSQPGIYDATVTIPGAGQVTLQARKGGSLYLVTLKDGQPVLKQLDPDEADPTSSFR